MQAGDNRFLDYVKRPGDVVRRQGTKIKLGFKFYVVPSMETFTFHVECLRFLILQRKKGLRQFQAFHSYAHKTVQKAASLC